VISIAMATYNGEKFLEQQLQSLSQQTRLPTELIICDDTSSDSTIEIIKRFSQTAPFPVKLVVNEQRLGWRQNFVKAASLCASEYIGFCDQDDVWLPEKLATVQSHLDKTRAIFLQHGYRTIDSAGALLSGPMTYEYLKRGGPWVHSYGLNQVFHRSLIEFFDLWELSRDQIHANEKMPHDEFSTFLASLLGKIVTINDVLLHYRQHGNNVVGFVPVKRYGGIGHSFLRTLQNVTGREARALKRKRLLNALRLRLEAATARRTMTEKVMSRLPEDRAHEVRPKLQYYQNYVRYQTARLAAYEGPTWSHRVSVIISMAGSGQYNNAGRSGARDAASDLFYGVIGSVSPTGRES
jgi:glycosyltransferase involved in cell wall biosynthesis